MHVMIDLETMSQQPDAAICAIGAVLFDPAAPGDGLLAEPFYRAGLLADAVRQGGHMQVDTVLWWLRQDDAARAEIWICAKTGSLQVALSDLGYWMCTRGVTDVWGNGADFDLTILAGTYRRASIKLPWTRKQQRCLRERRHGHRELKVPGDDRPQHHALHDAIWGARMAVAILREEARRAELAAHARKVAGQAAMSAAMSADIRGDISGAPL